MKTVMLCEKRRWGDFPTEGWSFEEKFDGIRILAAKLGDAIKITGRSGEDYTGQFPEIVNELRLSLRDFIVDGEMCSSKGDFRSLAGRVHLKDQFKLSLRVKMDPCVYHIFDMISLDGQRLVDSPLEIRKKAVEEFVADIEERVGPSTHIRAVVQQPLGDLVRRTEAKEIEGIVAKRVGSAYEFQRSPNWLKFRPSETFDLAIIGFEESDKPDRPFRSLILNQNGSELQASSGLSAQDLRELRALFSTVKIAHSVGKKRYFERPIGVCEITLSSAPNLPIRFPTVIRVRFDKSPEEAEKKNYEMEVL